ncbi:MAG TPA: ATP-binding protein, partial [Acidiferrobacteraceae bacterium]|nr:ATP-binding protein [Acidiferrobacteraceae bacterium]
AVRIGQQRVLFLSIRDIGWRKRAERSIRISEARFRAVTDTAKDAILITDAEGRLEYLNPAAEALFGHPCETVRGRSLGLLLPLRYRERYLHEFERINAHKGSRMLDRTLEIAGLRADDQEIPIELSLSGWSVENELHFTFVARDITARREAQNDIRQLNRRLGRRAHDLEALNHELEAFSYSVSHDLRAPLRSLDGFSQALLEECGDRLGPESTRHLHRIRAAAQKMGSLIDDLILLARITRLELRRETVDVSVLARRIFDEIAASEPERTVDLTTPETLPAEGDPRLLRMVFEHLLGNAWKFTRWASRPQVTLGHMDTGGEQVFFVRDNGDGFDMAYVDKLFRPFQRLHENHSFPGNGIGLAMVQRIIQKHGGRIWAHGSPGQGASFYFTLGAREDDGRDKDDSAH